MPLKMFKPSDNKTTHPLSHINHIVGIAAGKGGVGKSTVTANIALALQSAGYGVGIIDADLYGPSMRHMLPEKILPMQKGDYILPAQTHQGIQLISLSFFRQANEATAVRAPIAISLLTQFIRNIKWNKLDFLLIDFPPGTGDIQLTLSQQANLSGAILVTTPQEVSLLDVRKAAHLFVQTQIPVFGVVENMSYYESPITRQKSFIFGKGGGARLSEEMGVPFLGEIPIDPDLCRAGDLGYSIFENRLDPSPSASAFDIIAKGVVAAIHPKPGQNVNNIFELIWKDIQNPMENHPSSNIHAQDNYSTPSFIKNIYQLDNYRFAIQWNDGLVAHYALKILQKKCPCAFCHENKPPVCEDVRAIKIYNVGRYALQIQYTSGCSMGIYSFDMLRGGVYDP